MQLMDQKKNNIVGIPKQPYLPPHVLLDNAVMPHRPLLMIQHVILFSLGV